MITNVNSFYRSIAAILCSRLVLNLRGLILCPARHEEVEDMNINLKTLEFGGHSDGPTETLDRGAKIDIKSATEMVNQQ